MRKELLQLREVLSPGDNRSFVVIKDNPYREICIDLYYEFLDVRDGSFSHKFSWEDSETSKDLNATTEQKFVRHNNFIDSQFNSTLNAEHEFVRRKRDVVAVYKENKFAFIRNYQRRQLEKRIRTLGHNSLEDELHALRSANIHSSEWCRNMSYVFGFASNFFHKRIAELFESKEDDLRNTAKNLAEVCQETSSFFALAQMLNWRSYKIHDEILKKLYPVSIDQKKRS